MDGLFFRGMPTRVPLKTPIVQIAAGGSHTVFLTASGTVFTCGGHLKGQLGRPGPEDEQVKDKKNLWFAVPGLIPGIGKSLVKSNTVKHHFVITAELRPPLNKDHFPVVPKQHF